MEKATAEEPTKFIQFGCWNNINKKGCLENVMKKLNEYVTTDVTKPDFIVITGDNYYPQKEKENKDKDKNKDKVDSEPVVKEKKKDKKEKKETVDGEIEEKTEKKKIIMFNDIDHGFQLLPKNIPIYTILGNHDLETFDDEEGKRNLFVDELGKPRREENKQCEIVNKQIETISALPNISYDFFKSVKLANNTLLLMIDTSIYEKTKDSNKYLPCYQQFAKSNLPAETIDTLRAYQLTKIRNAIEEKTFSNIIIAGHHPIQQLKLKKGEDKIFTDIEDFKVVLNNINKLTPDSKFYYLCSDLHLYQEGTIHLPVDTGTMNIKQYIVGTGGTELDPMPLGNSGNELYTDITSIEKCGFLACDVGGSEPTFKFITPDTNLTAINPTAINPTAINPTAINPTANLPSAADASEIGGGKRKRRSKKYKSGTRRRRRNTRKKYKKR
jgi:hypothetical protein